MQAATPSRTPPVPAGDRCERSQLFAQERQPGAEQRIGPAPRCCAPRRRCRSCVIADRQRDRAIEGVCHRAKPAAMRHAVSGNGNHHTGDNPKQADAGPGKNVGQCRLLIRQAHRQSHRTAPVRSTARADRNTGESKRKGQRPLDAQHAERARCRFEEFEHLVCVSCLLLCHVRRAVTEPPHGTAKWPE